MNRLVDKIWMVMCLCFVLCAGSAFGQALSFSTGHRDIQPPDYATFRIGPLYSNVRFSQSVGYRYTASMKDAVDVRTGVVRGVIKDDGSDFPLESVLTVRNYLLFSKYADMDLSLVFTYMHFPLDTQEDQFIANITDEEIRADFSAEMRPTDYIRVLVYAHPVYITDFVDWRGLTDEYGGLRYERFENELGVNADFLVIKSANLGVRLQRTDVLPKGEEFEDQESVSHSGSIYYQQEVTPRLFAGIQAGIGVSDYPKTDRDESIGRSISASTTVLLTKSVTAGASLGYSVSSLSSSTGLVSDVDVDGVTGGVSLGAEITKDLSASLAYNRSQARGFREGIDVSDAWKCSVSWQGESLAIGLSTAMSGVEVAGGIVSGYSDWHNELRATYPLSKEMTLTLTSLYSVRTAGSIAEGFSSEDAIEELVSDYTTWTSRIGTEFVIARDASISIYAQYAVRESDNEDLEYESFQGGVELRYTYSHDF